MALKSRGAKENRWESVLGTALESELVSDVKPEPPKLSSPPSAG